MWAGAAVSHIRDTIDTMESKGLVGTDLREPLRFGS